jgi:hypothetical protein
MPGIEITHDPLVTVIEPGSEEAKAVDLRDLIAEILGTFVAGDYDELARPQAVASAATFRQHEEWRERAGLAPGAASRDSAETAPDDAICAVPSPEGTCGAQLAGGPCRAHE